MNTKLLDDYIKDLNEELDKHTLKPTRVPIARNFIASCLFKEINRVKDFRNVVKDIKDYGLKNVGDYLQAQIFVTPYRAYIQFNFSDKVPPFDEDNQDTEEYLLRKVERMLLALIGSDCLEVSFELRDSSQYPAFMRAVKYIFEPTYNEKCAIDTIAKAIIEDEEGVDL